jgi:hypothetical protein
MGSGLSNRTNLVPWPCFALPVACLARLRQSVRRSRNLAWALVTLFFVARSRCFRGCLTTAFQLVKHALSRGNARSFCPLRKDFEPLASTRFC